MEEIIINETCPIQISMNVIAGKWKIRIIYYLLLETLRFNELQRKLNGITHRSLALQLKELENDGLVIRKSYPVMPPKVEYSLSKLGQELAPTLTSLYKWGQIYQDDQLNHTDKL